MHVPSCVAGITQEHVWLICRAAHFARVIAPRSVPELVAKGLREWLPYVCPVAPECVASFAGDQCLLCLPGVVLIPMPFSFDQVLVLAFSS